MGQTIRLLAVMVSCVGMSLAQPAVTAVVNGASFDAAVPRGCLISIFGSRLARSTVRAASMPLPKKLEDTVVRVGDLELEAPLYFVSPGQINAQLPFEALGDSITLVVATSEGISQPFRLTPAAGPGLFTRDANGKGRALAYTPSFQLADTLTPGEPVILFATGLGPTDPPVLSGFPGSSADPFNRVTSVPEVLVGDVPAQVAFAGLAPGLAGVYQINVVPQAIGSDRLYVRSRGKPSNIVQIGLRAGQNVTSASGAIQVLFPTSDMQGPGVVGASPHLLVVRFNARMDIAASAGPFAIAVVSEGLPSSVITVDPANGTFEGLAPIPTARSRAFDFSGTDVAPVDLFTCRQGSGGMIADPFPGARIPASRISPQELQALNTLPLLNAEVAGSATGLLRVRGQVRPGSTFIIDQDNNSALSAFAGYIPVRTLCMRDQVTTVKLFIDGRVVASTELHYAAGGFPFTGDFE